MLACAPNGRGWIVAGNYFIDRNKNTVTALGDTATAWQVRCSRVVGDGLLLQLHSKGTSDLEGKAELLELP